MSAALRHGTPLAWLALELVLTLALAIVGAVLEWRVSLVFFAWLPLLLVGDQFRIRFVGRVGRMSLAEALPIPLTVGVLLVLLFSFPDGERFAGFGLLPLAAVREVNYRRQLDRERLSGRLPPDPAQQRLGLVVLLVGLALVAAAFLVATADR